MITGIYNMYVCYTSILSYKFYDIFIYGHDHYRGRQQHRYVSLFAWYCVVDKNIILDTSDMYTYIYIYIYTNKLSEDIICKSIGTFTQVIWILHEYVII